MVYLMSNIHLYSFKNVNVYIAESEGRVLFEGQRRGSQDTNARVIITFQGIYAPTVDFVTEISTIFDSSMSEYVDVMRSSFSSDISGIKLLQSEPSKMSFITYQPSSLPSVTPSISPTSQDTIAEISVIAGTANAAGSVSIISNEAL